MTDGEVRQVPLALLSPEKHSQLNKSTIMPRMYLWIEGYDLDKKSGAIVYDIEVGIQQKQIVNVSRVKLRYSALYSFDQYIRPLFKDSRFLRDFPPKKMFGNKDPTFLEERATALQRYLADLVKVTGMIQSPTFMRCFGIDPDLISDV